jgi:hypothetical protein
MLGAIGRALGRLASSIGKLGTRLRNTLRGIDEADQERVLIYDTGGHPCPRICEPLDGTIIRVVNGVPDPRIIPPGDTHPNCDCFVRPR